MNIFKKLFKKIKKNPKQEEPECWYNNLDIHHDSTQSVQNIEASGSSNLAELYVTEYIASR